MSADHTLRGWLDGLRRRWRALTRLRVSARQAAAVAVIAGAAWAVDAATSPTGLALVGLFIVAIVAAVAAVIGLQAPLRRPPSDRQLARLAEEQNGELDDVVVTATERLSAEAPGPLDGLLVRAAEARLREVEPERVIARDTMRRALRWTAAAAVVLAIALAFAWSPAWRAVQTARLYIAPPKLAVVVTPGHVRIARGTPLRITARLDGLPDGATPDVPALIVAAADAVPQPMRREGAAYVADWPKVEADFRYRVVAGALTSPEYQVSAIDAARVTRIDLEYAFPAFTKMAPRHEEDGGDIFGPAGTTVTIRVHTDKPVRRGAIALEGGTALPLRAEGQEATTLVAGLTIAQDGAYRIGIEDVDGLSSPEGTQYFVRVLDDRPPDVRIMRPAGDRQVTKLEEVVVEARADDDHGISSLELVYAVKGRGEKVVPFRRGAKLPSTSVNGMHTLFIEELDVEPGDFVTYYARARDVSRGKVSTEARSDIFFLEVRPFSEQFFAAQSQAGMGGGAGAAADLLESQKEIIVATWKLQRRAIAGQSATDVRAIARAQGELKVRAEALAAQQGRPAPRRRRAEPQAAPAAAGGVAAVARRRRHGPRRDVAQRAQAERRGAARDGRLQRAAQAGGGGDRASGDAPARRRGRWRRPHRQPGSVGAVRRGAAAAAADQLREPQRRRRRQRAERREEGRRARARQGPGPAPGRARREAARAGARPRRDAERGTEASARAADQGAGAAAARGRADRPADAARRAAAVAAGAERPERIAAGRRAAAGWPAERPAGGRAVGEQGSRGGARAAAGAAAAASSRRAAASCARRPAKWPTRRRICRGRISRRRGADRPARSIACASSNGGWAVKRSRTIDAAASARWSWKRGSSRKRRSGSPTRRASRPARAPGDRRRPRPGGADRRASPRRERRWRGIARRRSPPRAGAGIAGGAGRGAREAAVAQVNRAEAGDAAASAAVGARAELARGKPTEDMRKAADAMRRGAGGAEGAAREGAAREATERAGRAAETLARAADRMSGEGGGRDAARLSNQLAGLRQARQRAEAAEAALREAVERAMKAAEARKTNGGRPDPAADAKARAEIGRLQGEFDRALNDARRLAQRDGAAEGGRQASNQQGGQAGAQGGGQNGQNGQNGGTGRTAGRCAGRRWRPRRWRRLA